MFESLPIITEKEVFPDGIVQHRHLDNKSDGWHVIDNTYSIVLIKNNKLMQLERYSALTPNKLLIRWFFEYDENMAIYRQFPSQEKELWYDKNGMDENVKNKLKAATKNYDQMMANLLNTSMQLENRVENIDSCVDCGNMIVNCKNGSVLEFCSSSN